MSTAWDGARQLPPNWKALKRLVFKRDAGLCHVCHQPGADELDHIINVQRGGTDHPNNLAPIHHEPCHRRKTAQEAAFGRYGGVTRNRPPARHPGLR